MTDFKNYTTLLDGEVECVKCKGSGRLSSCQICDKCNGLGKLDWVSNAMEKPNHGMFIFMDSSSAIGSTITSAARIIVDDIEIKGKSFEQAVSDIVAKKLAEEIDKQILEQLKNDVVLQPRKGGKNFGNRIFSKLMFYLNFKQKKQNKENQSTLS